VVRCGEVNDNNFGSREGMKPGLPRIAVPKIRTTLRQRDEKALAFARFAGSHFPAAQTPSAQPKHFAKIAPLQATTRTHGLFAVIIPKPVVSFTHCAVIALGLVLATSFKSASAIGSDLQRYESCLRERGLDLDGYYFAVAINDVFALCPHIAISDEVVFAAAGLAEYLADDDRTPECAQARRNIGSSISASLAAAFKKEGENRFCWWARSRIDSRDDAIWKRFRPRR
jgi:hypothetical protein